MSDTTQRFYFRKDDKLKGRKAIALLFSSGKPITSFPLKMIWMKTDEPGIKAGVSVGSRNFKRAVDRNRIKRLMRECYRLQKHLINIDKEARPGIALFIIYTGKELPTYEVLYRQMNTLLLKLQNIFNEKSQQDI